MTLDRRIDAYFRAWNAHDAAALAELFTPDGTYEDPTTGGPVPADRVRAVLDHLVATFPDLAVEYTAMTGGDARVVVEWILRGRNDGELRPGTSPTGRTIALHGASVFELDGDRLRAVRGYYDQQTLVEQMGLMALIQPIEQGPAKYGYSMRVPSGNARPPGVIALTWIQGANEAEKERIRAHSRQNVQDFLKEPGFISIVTGFTGLRGFTVTAWEDEASLMRALAKHHAVAMKELFTENFVASVWTSVWTPSRINRIWVRCAGCAALEDVSDDHPSCSKCRAPLPQRPAFW